jgi:protein TonB
MRKLSLGAALLLACSLLGAALAHAAGRKVVKRVQPQYPELALKMRIEGTVKLEVDINEDGKVVDVRAVSGHPILKPAAVNCLKKWEFEPANGKTTELVEVTFKLPE